MKISIGISLRLAAGMVASLALAGVVMDRMESSRIEDQLIAEGEVAAAAGAAGYKAVLDLLIAQGAVTAKELLHPVYERIRWPVETCPDPRVQQVRPGMSPVLSPAPAPPLPFIGPTEGSSEAEKCIEVVPPRYHVGWDRTLETSGIAQIQDAIMNAGDGGRGYAYASGMIDGYVPVSHAKYNYPPIGDVECTDLIKTNCGHDVAYSRAKQKYLGQEQIFASGSPVAGWRPYLRNGHRSIDVFSPIDIVDADGKVAHWGGFRVGVILDRVDEHHRELTTRLAWLFGAVSILMIAMLYFIIDLKLFPLERLSDLTLWMGTTNDPKDLDQAVKSKRRRNGEPKDEIERMAKGVNQMRISLKGAMELIEQMEEEMVRAGIRAPAPAPAPESEAESE